MWGVSLVFPGADVRHVEGGVWKFSEPLVSIPHRGFTSPGAKVHKVPIDVELVSRKQDFINCSADKHRSSHYIRWNVDFFAEVSKRCTLVA